MFTTENSGPKTLTISNLTLAGVVGGSAIISGNAQGFGGNDVLKLSMDSIILNGIRTLTNAGAGAAPLLINTIGSYTELNLNNVKVEDGHPYDDLGTVFAATSLIGNVGDMTTASGDLDAHGIRLNFSNMALNGKIPPETGGTEEGGETGEGSETGTTPAESDYFHGTTGCIFSDAIFLTAFRYSDAATCSGTYNFIRSDDVPYTLGKELSNTNSGRNPELQYWFFGENDTEEGYVYKQVDPTRTAADCFANGYRQYVKEAEGETDAYYHELDINLASNDLLEGCGTYSHPYVIRTAGQLYALKDAISGSPRTGWKVVMNSTVLTQKSFSKEEHPTESEAASKDLEYTYDGSNWDNSAIADDVNAYLRNAYYLLTGPDDSTKEIVLAGDKWEGLGTASGISSAFSGVIVGVDDFTLKITCGSNSLNRFGGLIKFSQGSVVKNLKIAYTGKPTVTCGNVPTSTDNANFFGGVVGWCVGGDTIIEDVTVTYENTINVTGDKAYLAAIGGYVGLVGG